MTRYHRKIIHIGAEDSPNVRRGLECLARGVPPDDLEVVPGVISWREYQHRKRVWDKVKQCIALGGHFWEGAESLMYPPDWLDRAERVAEGLRGRKRTGAAMGVDSAMGGDNTAMAVTDALGLIDLTSHKTRDTSVIVGEVLALARRWSVPWERIMFDFGGGGKNHADNMRRDGYPVSVVSFGEPVTPPVKRGMRQFEERVEQKEARYSYVNRRAQMYGLLMDLLDPSFNEAGWGIPREQEELRRQLSLMPKLTDNEGRLRMLPKTRRTTSSKEQTLIELLGCSPDEADAVVLAVYGMSRRTVQSEASVS